MRPRHVHLFLFCRRGSREELRPHPSKQRGIVLGALGGSFDLMHLVIKFGPRASTPDLLGSHLECRERAMTLPPPTTNVGASWIALVACPQQHPPPPLLAEGGGVDGCWVGPKQHHLTPLHALAIPTSCKANHCPRCSHNKYWSERMHTDDVSLIVCLMACAPCNPAAMVQ